MTPLTLSPLRRGRAVLAGLAVTAFAAGASAGAAHADGFVVNDPALDVPAGKIEHVVRDFHTTGSYGRHTLDELYLGSDKAHWISRDIKTGKIVRETTFDRGKSLTYEADTNTITEMDDRMSSPPWQTVAQEAAIWKHTFQEGKTRQTGETTVDGRRALVLESVPGKWVTDEPSGVTTMVVDAETFVPYDVKTVLAKQDFTQDVAITKLETLDRNAQTEQLFALTEHQGAKHAVIAKKKPTTKAKKKAAKKHAKKHAAVKKHRR
jgi:hypothetical protein